jgi:hypothetical protein
VNNFGTDVSSVARVLNRKDINMQTSARFEFRVLVAAVLISTSLSCKPGTGTINENPSPAASPQQAASPAARQSTRPLPFLGKITAVDQRAKTFTVAGKQRSHVFKVTKSTTITKAGAAATMSDIVQNEEARGLYLKKADGTLEAKMVKIGPRTEGAAAESSPVASPEASPKP